MLLDAICCNRFSHCTMSPQKATKLKSWRPTNAWNWINLSILTWQMDLDFWWMLQRGNFYICIVHYLHDIYNATMLLIVLKLCCGRMQFIIKNNKFDSMQSLCAGRIDKWQKSNANWPQIIVLDFWLGEWNMLASYYDIVDL